MRVAPAVVLGSALLLGSVARGEAPRYREHFLAILERSKLGLSPREHAAWLVRDPDGTERLVHWPMSGLHRAQVWRGPLPQGVVALIHSHPADGNPRPSGRDGDAAQRLRIPVFTVSRWGVFRADADGSVIPVAAPFSSPPTDVAEAGDLSGTATAEPRLAQSAFGSRAGPPR